jgi:hypothetical protein
MPRLTAAAALIVFAVAGCKILGVDDPEGELVDHRRRWDALGISDYSFDFRRACYCGGPPGLLRVVVRQDAILSVTDLQTGAAPEFMPESWVGTIDDIFAELRREASRADEMKLQFDGEYHFPKLADVDRMKRAIDDEFLLTISNFQPNR